MAMFSLGMAIFKIDSAWAWSFLVAIYEAWAHGLTREFFEMFYFFDFVYWKLPLGAISDVLVSIFGLLGIMLCLWDSRISYLDWNYQSYIF